MDRHLHGYPDNLISALCEGYDLSIPEKPSADIHAGITYALSTLGQREQIILNKRFFLQLSRADIGKELQLTPERIRQIEHRALNKLRSTKRINFITYGIAGYMRIIKDHAYHKGYLAGYECGVEDFKSGIVNRQISPDLLDRPIQFLNLTTRPFNCLDRGGYHTIREISNLSQQEIRQIRNLGRKGLCEIAWALWNHGIRDTQWNNWLYSD